MKVYEKRKTTPKTTFITKKFLLPLSCGPTNINGGRYALFSSLYPCGNETSKCNLAFQSTFVFNQLNYFVFKLLSKCSIKIT